MEKKIIIDGYNLIHKITRYKNLLRKNLESSRNALIEDLKTYSDIIDSKIILVFDGSEKHKFIPKESIKGVKVIFSSESADYAIERMTYQAEDKSGIIVVTDDNLTRNLIFGMGAVYLSCDGFYKEMEQSLERFGESLRLKSAKNVLKHKLKL